MARAVVEQDARLIRRRPPVDIEYGEPKRRSVRSSWGVGALAGSTLTGNEEEQGMLMSGGNGEGGNKRRTKIWGLGRWF